MRFCFCAKPALHICGHAQNSPYARGNLISQRHALKHSYSSLVTFIVQLPCNSCCTLGNLLAQPVISIAIRETCVYVTKKRVHSYQISKCTMLHFALEFMRCILFLPKGYIRNSTIRQNK